MYYISSVYYKYQFYDKNRPDKKESGDSKWTFILISRRQTDNVMAKRTR